MREENYKQFAGAIVMQAVWDYQDKTRELEELEKENSRKRRIYNLRQDLAALKRFFNSSWCDGLLEFVSPGNCITGKFILDRVFEIEVSQVYWVPVREEARRHL